MEVKEKEKLGTGLTVVFIILLVKGILFAVFNAIGLVLVNAGMLKDISVNINSTITSIVLNIVLTISIILLMLKKKVGLFIYSAYVICGIISDIVFVGFNLIDIIVALIFPILVAYFISKKLHLYRIQKSDNI